MEMATAVTARVPQAASDRRRMVDLLGPKDVDGIPEVPVVVPELVRSRSGQPRRLPPPACVAVIGRLSFPGPRAWDELDRRPADTAAGHVPVRPQPDAVRLVFARQKPQHQSVTVKTVLFGQAIESLAKFHRRRGVDWLGCSLSIAERLVCCREPNRPLRRRGPIDRLRRSAWPSDEQDNETNLVEKPIHSTWTSLARSGLFVN